MARLRGPGLTDAEAFYAADPGGFDCTTLEGRTAAMISVVKASQDVAFVGFDVPLVNTGAVEQAESRGVTRGFEARRMYRESAPDLPLEQIFGTTRLELG